jgi:hypothetical protein
MSKSHIVNLTIINNSDLELQYNHDWFDSGRLADGNNWPQKIAAGQTVHVECYEKDWALAGCSGWVKYTTQGKDLFFCFSNPTVGKNGIAFGDSTGTWNSMGGEYDNGITQPVNLNGSLWVVAHVSSTEGDNNQARWELKKVDVNAVVTENIQMDDVQKSFNAVSPTGSRQYYKSVSAPTNVTGLAQSHFKGISTFSDKFIFSHTNLTIPKSSNGVYLVADKITVSDIGSTELTADTQHQGWQHPCASQACGSFMALGIQETADNPSNTSEVEIYDIRKTAINQQAVLLGSIKRDKDGVNGVAITRATDGHYLVAANNSNRLTVYRSDTTSLIPFPTFSVVIDQSDFAESGVGMALITQKNGDVFIIGMDSDDNGDNNHISLFKLDFNAKKANRVATKLMPIPGLSDSITYLKKYILAIMPVMPVLGAALEVLLKMGDSTLNSSFRWGKGVNITSSTDLEIYATDRNSIPLSDIPLVGSDKDFSLVTWKTVAEFPPVGKQFAIKTNNGKNYVTVVNGGGLDSSFQNAAFATNRRAVGPWEQFTLVTVDANQKTFALKANDGNFVTAVNAGGIGGPNDATSPLHTDATAIGAWEALTLEKQGNGTYALKTPSGFYLTALNAGGFGEAANKKPIHTDAKNLGPWETFTFVEIK